MASKTQKQKECPGCGKTRKLKKQKKVELCNDCSKLAELLLTKEEQLNKVNDLLSKAMKQAKVELPEVLDAVRYRTRDRELNSWYVSISEMEGEPVEIFASTAFDRDQHLQSRISNLTTITRLVSLILRHISLDEELTLEKTLTQLHRSSRQRNDLPDMLVRVLSKYSKKPQEIKTQDHETP